MPTSDETTSPKPTTATKTASKPKTTTKSAPVPKTTAKVKTAPTSKTTSQEEVPTGVSVSVIKDLKRELENMLMFAIHNGKTINTDINPLIESNSLDDLISAHNILCKNIAPATPKSISYLSVLCDKDKTYKSLFKKLPIIRNLIILALLFLAIFIGTSLSSQVNGASLSKGILNNSGMPLFLNMMFLSSISGLGVVFYLLRSVSSGIQLGTLKPEESIYYVALIVLGIISGLILSEIVSLYDDGKSLSVFNNSVLALIGGFSSDAIFSILQGVINKIKAVFSTNSTN